jgi:hypothetical protein
MTTNLRDIAADLKAFEADVKAAHTEHIRAVGGELLELLVQSSPVDTGHFKANWQVSIGRPATGIVNSVDPGGAQTIARGTNVLRRVKAFDTVYLTNNVPYAQELEEGSLQRPPASMVKAAVAAIQGRAR